jgi:DNA-binding NarL/FixJ family response regulator
VWPGSDEPSAGGGLDLALIGGDRLIRAATAGLLETQEGFRVRGAFESATEFLASEGVESVRVVLLDCDQESSLWCSAVNVLSRFHARARIVMVCRELSPEVVHCAMQHRVGGVVLKSYSAEDIREAIRYMASGRTVMPAGWQQAAVPLRARQLAVSPRLRQILTLIAQGRSNEEIADALQLSPNTIKFHVRTLYARLGVRNRVEATRLYTQMTDCVD